MIHLFNQLQAVIGLDIVAMIINPHKDMMICSASRAVEQVKERGKF